MKTDLIIFDLDGVIIDSLESICYCFNYVLRNNRIEEIPEDRIKPHIGRPLPEVFIGLLPDNKKRLANDFADQYREIYRKTCVEHSKLFPGVIGILGYLKGNGIKIAAATTKRGDVSDFLLNGLGIKKYFGLILGLEDVKKPKPDPEMLNLVIKRMCVEKGRAIFVGDTSIDIEAGKRAGIKTVFVTYGYGSKENLTEKPDYTIDNLEELKKFV